ncbi:Morn repeat protein [Pelomyxa schiedti]|nr:Morn repeat protein [Pelomyxa schiedti]
MSGSSSGLMVQMVENHYTSPDNGTYTGRLVGNIRDGTGTHGRGLYTWPDGSTYNGEYSKGDRDGWGTHTLADGSRYQGLWSRGNWDVGTWFTEGNTEIYNGYWEYNESAEAHEMQVWGVHVGKALEYEGGWDRNEWHGHGTWRSRETGDIYCGMFDHGKKSGRGKMLFGATNQGGGSYIGGWQSDMFHGKGVRLWANGDRHEGQWVRGKEHGTGRKTWASDGKSFDGVWEMGVMKSGTMKWPNGDQFTGTFMVSGDGDGKATFQRVGGDGSTGEGTLKNGIFQERANMRSHCMGCADVNLMEELTRLKTENQSLKQKLHEQTQCVEHTLKQIQQGVWVKSISTPSPQLRRHSQSTKEEEVKSRSCVMKKVSVTLEKHNIGFAEEVCSLCPLDKIEVEKRFGLNENQQVISFSVSETTLSASPSLSLSQLVSPVECGIPEMKVRMEPVLTINEADLKFASPLGSGSYGTVVKCMHTPSGREVAVKTLYDIISSERNVASFMLEAEIVSALRHPNIVECIGTSTTGTGKLQIVSELMCCSLRQLLKQKRLSIKEVSAIALDVAKGMDSLHRQNFMHRDLSSNNVLFDANGVPKICDFGVSRAMDPQGTTTTRLITQGTNRTIGPGTPVYMAPQMATAHYSIKGDMWGFGILMTEMLNGDIVDSPFDSLPLRSQADFMNEQRRLLSPQEVEEVNKLCRESRESFIASCLSRRNASIDAVTHLMHSPDSPLLQLTDGLPTVVAAAADLVVLAVESCLSILERDRFPFTVIVKLMLCCCTAIVSSSQTATTAGGTVTDDQVNECITQWLNALLLRSFTIKMSGSSSGLTVQMVENHHTSPDNGTYTGRLVGNIRDGTGTCTWPDGTTYHGEWRDDNRHGRGVYTWPDGSTYNGEYSNGSRDGWGTHVLPDGSRYEGLWRDGNWKLGKWFTEGNTEIYNGYWECSDAGEAHEMQGRGLHIGKDLVYDGMWDRNEWHGHGTWRSRETDDIYCGMFHHGKKSGRGKILFDATNQGGGSYIGGWQSDMFHGRGVRLWANGDRHEGQWVRGKEHGTGRKTWACDGKSFDGVWEMGVIKSGTMRWSNGDQFTGTFMVSGDGDGKATFQRVGGDGTTVEGTLKNGIVQERGSMRSHSMGCGDVNIMEELTRLKTENQSLKQKLHEQTQCFEHVLMHIQQGVWVKSISAPSPPLRDSQSTQEVRSRLCVMKKIAVTLERHHIGFAESVCSLCPLDKVVKMAVEKRFGLDENQQVISLSVLSHSETTLSAFPSLSFSQLVSPVEGGIPEMKVQMEPVLTINESDLKFVSPLGSGSYGTVVKCMHTPSGREVAVKTLYDIISSERNVSSFMLEAEIVSALRHPNIVGCIGTSTTGTGKLQIVSELMCCSLRQLLAQV